MTVRVAVLSDDRQLSEALLRAINADAAYLAVSFTNGSGLRIAVRSARPHVVVIDQNLPGALALCAEFSAGDSRAILVNVNEQDDSAVDALSAGARGIIFTSASPDEVVKALQVVLNNQIWGPRRVIVAAWTRMRTEIERRNATEAAFAQRLSSREREVFRYAAAGLGNKEVANRLAISEATVKVHLTHIFQKLGLKGRGELAAAYHGILR